MNYENIRLDKNMYKTQRGFFATLENHDPSKLYSGTELAGLDAYQRQLKRFDIKVNGSNSDVIAKFFQTSDSATLFPEYVSRAVVHGMRDTSIVDEIVASKSNISSLDYRSISMTQNDGSSGIQETNINLNENLVRLVKRGRLLKASYEAIKFQRIDVLTVALKQIGAYIAKSMLNDALDILLAHCGNAIVDGNFNYTDILSLWGKFEDFEMNTLLASPDMAIKILAMKEFQSMECRYNNILLSPLEANLIKTPAVPKGTIIALDRNFALEMVEAGGVSVDYDKLIDADFEGAAITTIFGFNKIFHDAVKCLKVV